MNSLIKNSVYLCAVFCFTLFCLKAGADLIIDGSTAEWTPILYPNNYPDPSLDQQTGGRNTTEQDIVGNQDNPSFYFQFYDGDSPSLTDGILGFRTRVGEDKNPSGFNGVLFIGIDFGPTSDGELDLYLGINNSGNNDDIAIWDPGTDDNSGPSSTSIVSPPPDQYRPEQCELRLQHGHHK